jgi:hypothetical protein
LTRWVKYSSSGQRGIVFDRSRGHKSHRRPVMETLMIYPDIIFFFKSILSATLNDPCRTAHPITEDTLHIVTIEIIPHQCKVHSISSFDGNSRSTRIPFKHCKDREATRIYIWGRGWMDQS